MVTRPSTGEDGPTTFPEDRMLAVQADYAERTRAGDVDGLAALFAPEAVVWHSYDERTYPAHKAVGALGEVHRSMPGVRWEDVSVCPTAHGFVWQAVMVCPGSSESVRVHTCSVAKVGVTGLIERLDEYVDPATFAPLTASGARVEVLGIERDGPVTILTLNRPDQLNAFDEKLHQAFARFWVDLERDRDTRVVVLTGAGRAFSAGGNLSDFELFRADVSVRTAALRNARRLVDEMLNTRVPVIAAVNGAAIGLGCTLATLCDTVFLADDAQLADPHVAVALVAGDGGAVTWPHLTSLLKAKQYLLSGDPIPPYEALAMGLANFVVPRAEVLPKAIAWAKKLASLPPQAVQDTKAVLNQHLRSSAVVALGFGLASEHISHDTDDYAAVPQRFRSRTRPRIQPAEPVEGSQPADRPSSPDSPCR